MSEFLTTNSVAKTLGLSPETVLYHVKLGRLPAIRTESGLRIFQRSDVEAFRKKREVQTTGNRYGQR